ncbi:MAG: SH3 domain-containing protein [Erythrobacter sp.]
MRSFLTIFTFVALLSPTSMATAQNRETPYWAAMRAGEVNMRVGPSPDYRIDWVYKRKGLPVKVIRVMEGWRLIQDKDGTQGWVVARLLTPDRGALVVGEGLAAMKSEPTETADLKWNLEPGVVGVLGSCADGWCRINVQGRDGWVKAERLWGDGDP